MGSNAGVNLRPLGGNAKERPAFDFIYMTNLNSPLR